jgi:hypothetical protein
MVRKVLDDVNGSPFDSLSKTGAISLDVVMNEFKNKATIIKDYGKLPQVNCYLGRQIQNFDYAEALITLRSARKERIS